MIQMNNITKRFGAQTVLSGVTLHAEEKEIFGLLGPSGAGKTTIINILTNQLTADGGTQEKVFLCIAVAAIIGYFIGWFFYFSGYQSVPLMLFTLVALPPVYYASIGLWRGNYALTVLGGVFLIAHLSNVWNNLK